MKSTIKNLWMSIPVWGRIFIGCFVFYLCGKTFGKN